MPGAKQRELKRIEISYGEWADSDELKCGGAPRDYIFFTCLPERAAQLRGFALRRIRNVSPTPKPSVTTSTTKGATWWAKPQVKALLKREGFYDR